MKESLNGSYGKTYNAQWISKNDRSIVLIKLDKPPTKSELLFYTEFQSHSHIIYTFGFVENNLQSFILLQERASHGNFQLLLEKNQFQPSIEILIEIFLQIIDAMIYITNQKFVHGDLRCANILVFQIHEFNPKENLVKLTNFSSVHRNDPLLVKDHRWIIPVRYCAPEILRSAGQSNYSELSDVYSMGVLMWEACSNGQIPYSSSSLKSEVRQRKLNGEKLIKPWLCDNRIWSIMEDCWHNEPKLRYNFSEMKSRLSYIDPK
jgi:serine/threonine protein kinase